jgi:hypothetical protein
LQCVEQLRNCYKIKCFRTYSKREFATAQLVPQFRNSIVTYLNFILTFNYFKWLVYITRLSSKIWQSRLKYFRLKLLTFTSKLNVIINSRNACYHAVQNLMSTGKWLSTFRRNVLSYLTVLAMILRLENEMSKTVVNPDMLLHNHVMWQFYVINSYLRIKNIYLNLLSSWPLLAGYKPSLNSQGTLEYRIITGTIFLMLDCSYLTFKA